RSWQTPSRTGNSTASARRSMTARAIGKVCGKRSLPPFGAATSGEGDSMVCPETVPSDIGPEIVQTLAVVSARAVPRFLGRLGQCLHDSFAIGVVDPLAVAQSRHDGADRHF